MYAPFLHAFCQSVSSYMSICLSVHMSVSVCQASLYLLVCWVEVLLDLYAPFCLHMSASLYVYLSACHPMYIRFFVLFFWNEVFPIFISLFVCLSVHMSVCLSPYIRLSVGAEVR